MNELKEKRISKSDFLKIKEKDVMFITNPGRMGDEDGSTFIVKNGDEFTSYRIEGWMYPTKNTTIISMEEMAKQFPEWYEAWKCGDEKDYKGKYIHLYMGFGNGLNIDRSIYEKYKPYLDKAIAKDLEKYSTTEKEKMKYASIYTVWKLALIEMAKDYKWTLQ